MIVYEMNFFKDKDGKNGKDIWITQYKEVKKDD